MVVYLGIQEGGEDVDVNSYLIVSRGRGFFLDLGGYKIFLKVFVNVFKYVDLRNIEYIYICYQDFDVVGSFFLWREISNVKIVIYWFWMRFLLYFGFEDFKSVIYEFFDEGEILNFGVIMFEFIFVYFFYSLGYFMVYDCRSKFLFIGDIGIVFLDDFYIVVENMERYI